MKTLSVSPSALIIASLLMLGVLFTFNVSSTFAQPCQNNAHGVVGTGKQIFKQSNRCTIVENSNIPTTTCPPDFILQNGVCVPTTITCPIGSILQNGVCVPFTNPTQSAPVAVAVAQPSSTVGNNFVQLNGLGSYATTSGATIVSYSWVQTSGTPVVSLSGANTAIASFVAPTVSTTTTLTFSLTVTDSNGRVSAPNSVAVTITS